MKKKFLYIVFLITITWLPFFIYAQTVLTATSSVTVTATVCDGECLVATSSTPVEVRGGGGIGSGGYNTPSSVVFSGNAVPFSKVIILQDGQKLTEVYAGVLGKFKSNTNNFYAGVYNFSVFSEDDYHNYSDTFNITLNINPNSNISVNNINLSNFISKNKKEDNKDQNTNKNTEIKQENEISNCNTKWDFNNDCKVNLIDFSIMLYWYNNHVLPPKNIDLNKDTKINIEDFSILAYHWTG